MVFSAEEFPERDASKEQKHGSGESKDAGRERKPRTCQAIKNGYTAGSSQCVRLFLLLLELAVCRKQEAENHFPAGL